jgi:hypothetical protein
MKVRYKEDPTAWRKSTLLSVLALGLLSSVLAWRHVLAIPPWRALFVLLVLVGAAACVRPQWFRSYYRFSTWAGFWSSQCVARVLLSLIFLLVVTPAGIILRLMGKDSLCLKRSAKTTSYWRPARQDGSLDRLF